MIDITLQRAVTFSVGLVHFDEAWIERALVFTSNTTLPGKYLLGYNPQLLDLSMSVAIYEGALGRPNEVSTICSTGNCTWGPFESLAIRSHCNDYSKLITKEAINDTEGSYDVYSVPDGLRLGSPNVIEVPDAIFATVPALRNLSQSDSSFFLLSEVRALTQTQYYECSLYFCVQEYNSTVVNGALTESIIHTWANNYTTNSSDDGQDWFYIPTGYPITNFSVESDAYFALAEYLAKVMNGTLYDTTWEDEVFDNATGSAQTDSDDSILLDVFGDIGNSSDTFYLSSPNLTALPRVMADISKSITNRMRQGPDGTLVRGVASNTDTYIMVQWEWLSLTATLLFLTLVFLIATILDSKRCHIEVWKDSPFPPFFHGLNRSLLDQYGKVDESLSMDEASKEMQVQLVQTEAGWRLE